ncbi:MAG: ferredoxin [Pseudonocardiaceae bacterium]|nr:ferredoxin [Pseudonocardiaceae bacterium]
MEIHVDPDKCCGYGDCVLAAPDVFDLGDDGVAFVISGAEPSLELAQEAADACPVAAIEITP